MDSRFIWGSEFDLYKFVVTLYDKTRKGSAIKRFHLITLDAYQLRYKSFAICLNT